MKLLQGWTLGFCPLNAIERSLSDLIDARESNAVERTEAVLTAEDAVAMLEPEDILIDCTGSKSLLRDRLTPSFDGADRDANTLNIRLEYALVITFCTAKPTTATNIASTTRTSRTRTTSSFRWSTAHTTTAASATSRASSTSPRGLRGDARTIRRRMASQPTFPMSRSRWIASSTRSSRKLTAR